MVKWRRTVISRRKLLIRLLAVGVVGVISLVFCFVLVSMPEARGKVGSDLRHAVEDRERSGSGVKEKSSSRRSLDEDRVAEYCNVPSQVMEGQEGESPEDYHLLSVFAFIRHGDRTPMSSFLNIPHPSLPNGCLMDDKLLQTVPELRNFVQDIQHQERQRIQGDFIGWSLYPQHASCGSSELTGQGAIQHLFNGVTLRRKYRKILNEPGFSPSKHVAAHSTATTRTYQSAIAFLYGLLPRFDIAELHVRAASNVMFCQSSLVPAACCASLGKLRQEADLAVRVPHSMDKDWIAAMPPLAAVFGVKVGKLPSPMQMMDVLQGHTCHDLPMPCRESDGGGGRRCVTLSMLGRIWAVMDGIGKRYSAEPKFDRYSRTVMHSLLLETLKSMREVTRNHSAIKFTLHSGHDLTLTPLLQTLGLYDGKWPQYATRVVVEMYEKSSTPGRYYLRVLRDGSDVTSRVRFCRGRVTDGMCPLELFEEFVTRDNMDIMGVSTMQELQAFCQSKVQF